MPDNPPRPRPRLGVSLRMVAALSVVFMIVVGMSALRRVAAIRRIEHFNGSVHYLHGTRGWLAQWIGEDRIRWLDDPEHIVFWPDEENIHRRSRFGGIVLPISGPLIDDEGLCCVLGVPGLKSLDLAFSNISDAGVRHLVRLPTLESLRLEGSDVSDASIPALSQMRTLKELNVEHTQITRSGSRNLEAALPGCEVRGPHNDKWTEMFR